MNTIHVSIKALKALLNAAGKKDIRHYLNGVQVQASTTETRISATNGHIAAIYRKQAANVLVNPCEVLSIIIPREVLEKIKLNKRAPDLVEIAGERPMSEVGSTRYGKFTLTYDGMVYGFNEIDGVFPDIKRVAPDYSVLKPVEVSPANYSPEYLVAFQKTIAGIRGNSGTYRLTQHGTLIGVISDGTDDFVGVIMPLKDVELPRKSDTPWARMELPGVQLKTTEETLETVAA